MDEKHIAHGSLFGIDSSRDRDLMWVVLEATKTPLPEGWEERVDESGCPQFFDALSGRSLSRHPTIVVYQEVLALVKETRSQGDRGDTWLADFICGHLDDVRQRAISELSHWSGPEASSQGLLYCNTELDIRTPINPAERWDRELALRRRILCECLLPKASSPAVRRLRVVIRGIILAKWFEGQLTRSYTMDARLDPKVIAQIDADIHRTSGGNSELEAGLGTARSMLLRYAAEDPDLGYCQGMNMVATLFAVASCTQEDAYARFHAFTQRLRGLWLPGFPLLHAGIARFVTLAGERPWFQHLGAHAIDPAMYLPQAWMTVFATWLKLPTRVLLLRHLEEKGFAGLLAMALAVLDGYGGVLTEYTDVDDLLPALGALQSRQPHVADVLAGVDEWLPRALSAMTNAESMDLASTKVVHLIREGSRVLDGEGRELVFRRAARLSTRMRSLASRSSVAGAFLRQWTARDTSEQAPTPPTCSEMQEVAPHIVGQETPETVV